MPSPKFNAAYNSQGDGRKKLACLYPLPDGRRCCECENCQGRDAAWSWRRYYREVMVPYYRYVWRFWFGR